MLLRLEWSLVSRTSCLSCSSTSTGGKIGGLHCSQLLLCVSGLASWPSICKWTHEHSPAFVLQVLALAFAIRIPLKNEPSSVLLFCLQDNLFTLTPALVNIFLYLHFAKLGRVISEDYRLAERNQSFAWKWWVSSNLHPLDISFISIFLLFPSSPDTLAVSLIISDTVFYLSQAIGSAFQVERQNWSQKLCLGGILLQVRWSDVATERTLSKWQQPLIIDFFTVNHFRFLHGHLYQSSSHRQEAPIWNAKLGTSRIVICQQVRVYRVSTHHQEFHYFLLVWCLDDCKCSRFLFSSRHPLSTSSLDILSQQSTSMFPYQARSLIRIVWISQTPHWRGGLARSGSLGPIIDILPVNQGEQIENFVWFPSSANDLAFFLSPRHLHRLVAICTLSDLKEIVGIASLDSFLWSCKQVSHPRLPS